MAKGLWSILNVDNVDKSVEFYKSIGLKAEHESQGPMSWGIVRTSSSDCGFVLMDKHQIVPGQPEDTRAWLSGEMGKGVLLAIGVPNAQKLWEKAQAARVVVDLPLREQEWGGKEFTVVDPDGYVVNITDKFPGMSKPAKKATRKAKAPARKAKKAKPKRR